MTSSGMLARDGSVAMARQTAAEWGRDLRVVINETNSGSAFRQWRRAAELAHGDFLWIAEADDSSDARFLEKLAEAISDAPETVLGFTDSRSIDGEGKPVWPSYRAYYAESAGPDALARDGVFLASGFARRFLTERNLILNASAVLWRRQALADALDRCAADLASYRMAGDWRVYLEALADSDAGSVVYVSAPLNVHRRHGRSITRQLDAERHVDEIRRIHRLAAERLRAGPDAQGRQQAYLRQVTERLRAEATPAGS